MKELDDMITAYIVEHGNVPHCVRPCREVFAKAYVHDVWNRVESVGTMAEPNNKIYYYKDVIVMIGD